MAIFFLWSFATLAVMAATWIAYAHPRKYRTFIFLPAVLIICSAVVGVAAYSIGIDHASLALDGAKSLKSAAEIREVRDLIQAHMPSGYWLLAGFLAFAYINGLCYLEHLGVIKTTPK